MLRSTLTAAVAAVAGMWSMIAWAGIPEPDAILYGHVYIDGVQIHAGNDVVVVARVDEAPNLEVMYQYTDPNPDAEDNYILRIPLESLADGSTQSANAALVGQTVHITVQQSGVACEDITDVVINERGHIQELDVHTACGGTGPECQVAADCADIDDDDIRDDGCVWWACDAGVCTSIDVTYADFGGLAGACVPDGTADGNDRFHALNCFANTNTAGAAQYPCEAGPPVAFNVDAAGLDAPCTPDGVCDGNDAFAALNAFEGTTSCSCPSGPAPSGPAGPRPVAARASIRLASDRTVVRPGETVGVRLFLDAPLPDLRGYQLHLGVSGAGPSSLELVDIVIEDRTDQVFAGMAPWKAFNRVTHQMLAGLDSPGIKAEAGGYLATFTYRAGKDASGSFKVQLLHDSSDPAQRTVLFPTPARGRIEITSIPVVIDVAATKPAGRPSPQSRSLRGFHR